MSKLAVLASILVAGALAIAVHAQTGAGKIEGLVADPSGAVIPGADVALWSDGAAVQKVKETKSDVRGKFAFANLTPGRYAVRVESPGFRNTSVNVVVEEDKTALVSAVLEIGLVSERIEVTAGAPALQADSSSAAPLRSGVASGFGGVIFKHNRQAAQNTETYDFVGDGCQGRQATGGV